MDSRHSVGDSQSHPRCLSLINNMAIDPFIDFIKSFHGIRDHLISSKQRWKTPHSFQPLWLQERPWIDPGGVSARPFPHVQRGPTCKGPSHGNHPGRPHTLQSPNLLSLGNGITCCRGSFRVPRISASHQILFYRQHKAPLAKSFLIRYRPQSY